MKIKNLKKGDKFSFIPKAWHGPGTVIESRESGKAWVITFANTKVINPPGVFYASPDTQVRRLRKGAK